MLKNFEHCTKLFWPEFLILCSYFTNVGGMLNSVDPDQTAPGAVSSGSLKPQHKQIHQDCFVRNFKMTGDLCLLILKLVRYCL